MGDQRKIFEKEFFFLKIWLGHFDQCAMPKEKMVLLFILPLGNPQIWQDPTTQIQNDQALFQARKLIKEIRYVIFVSYHSLVDSIFFDSSNDEVGM